MTDFKEREIFANLKGVVPGILRIDGRAFHTLTKQAGFKKPFDPLFKNLMCSTLAGFINKSGFSPALAVTHSDEMSVLFVDELPFDGRIEKMCSTSASFMGALFARGTDVFGVSSKIDVASFDARFIQLHNIEEVNEYFKWRQDDSYRNFVQGYGHQLLVEKHGCSDTTAASKMKGGKNSDIHELCFKAGLNLNDKPVWEKRGNILYFKRYMKDGYNPIKNEKVVAERYELVIDDAPIFGSTEGLAFLNANMRRKVPCSNTT